MTLDPNNTPGTEAEAPAGGSGTETPTPTVAELQAQLTELRTKREADLERLTPLEEARRERDDLRELIAERTANNAPPAGHSGDDTEDLEAFEQRLYATARNPQASLEERQFSKYVLGLAAFARRVPVEMGEKLAFVSMPEDERTAVEKIRKEAAAAGNRISPEYARTVYRQQREIETLKARPVDVPGRINPAANVATAAEMTQAEYGHLMRTLPDAERDVLYKRKVTGALRVKRPG